MGLLEILGISIPTYVWIGLFLFLVGLVLAVYVPFIGKKSGLALTIIGLFLMVGISIFKSLWQNEIWFQITVIATVFIILITLILYPGKETKK